MKTTVMSDERREELHQLGTFKICEHLHMHNMMSSDPISDRDYQDYQRFLINKKHTWEEGLANSRLYDSAVYALVCATLMECKGNRLEVHE